MLVNYTQDSINFNCDEVMKMYSQNGKNCPGFSEI